MIILYRILYSTLLPFGIFFGLIFSKKFRNWLRQRPSTLKQSSRKSLWIHASSGEFEHAKGLIRELKKQYPYQRIVVTYSSPSYFNQIKSSGLVDEIHPLPFDLPAKVSFLIKRINPRAVLYAKTDMWPELVHQLKERKIPQFLFARYEPKSKISIFEKLQKSLTYKKINHVFCVSAQDKENLFSQLKLENVSVAGDPRVDEVLYRKDSHAPTEILPNSMILGSLWPKDLKVISKTLKNFLKNDQLKHLIITPHEIKEEFIEFLQESFEDFNPLLFSRRQSLDPDRKVVIVDEVGQLFELYSMCEFAFVGGSYGKQVHSILEPLCHGLPVLAGPKVSKNIEAHNFGAREHGFVKICTHEEEFANQLKKFLLLSKEEKDSLRKKIAEEVANKKGASHLLVKLLKQHKVEFDQ